MAFSQRLGSLRLFDACAGALLLLMPLSVFWQLGAPAAQGVLPLYVAPGIFLTDLAAALMILASLPRQGAAWRALFRRWRSPVVLRSLAPLAALALLGFMTAPWALSPGLAVYTSARWLLAMGVYLAWLAQPRRMETLAPVFLAGLGLQAMVGALQFLFKGPLGLPGELALRVDQSRAAVIYVDGSSWLRAYGLTFHPNVLGGFLAVGLLVCLPLLDRWFFRFLWWGLAAGLALTFSRSAWLAAAVTLPPLAAWLAWKQPAMRRPLLVTLGVAAGAGLLGGALLARPILGHLDVFASLSEYTSISARGELIDVALRTILSHPFTGIGAGNFPLAALGANIHDVAHSVHHVALLLASEVGAPGAGLWYWLWLAPVLSLEKRLRSPRPWPVALAAAWFALGFIGLWDSYPWSLDSGRLLTVTLLAWYTLAVESSSFAEASAGDRILASSLKGAQL